ncbi:Testis-specific serine/threonine-protein kinase 4 [Blomia tropicalis]|nr:Testis-specific serine/threonine-protein kinase 4 [Blomia tropicalis]
MSNDSMLNLTESSINSHDSMRFTNLSNESVFLSSKSIKIQHVIAKFGPTNERIQKKKSKKLENNNLNKLIPTKYTIISCDSILSPDESMDKSSPTKSHEDFEIPSSLVPIFQYKGFTLEQPIGHGTYGKVYCAIRHGSNDQTKGWQHQERYAIKVMDMNRLSFQYRNKFLHKELNALLSIKPHCHIVKFYDVFKSSCAIDDFQYDKLINIVMEYCPKGDMYEYVSQRCEIGEPYVRRWFHQLLSAIGHIHSQGFAHRDLKLENLLFDSYYNLKVSDFGFCSPLTNICEDGKRKSQGMEQKSNRFREKRSYTFCGSLLYCSPELILGRPYLATINDVWSCGVILFVLLYGTYPVNGNLVKSSKQFNFGSIEYPETIPISEECRQIFRHIFVPEKLRSNVEQLQCLKWVKDYDERKLFGSFTKEQFVEQIERLNESTRQEILDFASNSK